MLVGKPIGETTFHFVLVFYLFIFFGHKIPYLFTKYRTMSLRPLTTLALPNLVDSKVEAAIARYPIRKMKSIFTWSYICNCTRKCICIDIRSQIKV